MATEKRNTSGGRARAGNAPASRKALARRAPAKRLGACPPVVGIGASAGGLETLKEFFEAMPADGGMAFVVIQHLDPDYKSQMAELLASHTAMKVVMAEDGLQVEPNAVYLIPPNKYLSIHECALHLTPARRDGIRMPIDFFFRSAAEELQDSAAGVILSGTGSDGVLGVRAIRAAGGIVVVQDPTTAQFDAMPRNAIATGMADFVLPVQQMPKALLFFRRQYHAREEGEPGDAAGERQEDVAEILNLLLRQCYSDFRGYKRSTIMRRIARRMGINQVTGLSDYLRLLRQDSEELNKLSKEMLIGVTGFFRDPEAFEELRKVAIAPIAHSRDENLPVRVWVPGCATGEEAYSVAMLVLEELRAIQKGCPLQVFASDIDEEALAVARAGIYPMSIGADISPERLERFFVRHEDGYQVAKAVRDCLVFTSHNLIAAPPFSRLDLISCRNVLIYLEPGVQEEVISLFGFALNRGGVLFLGRSESTANHSEFFEPISKRWRIYRRTGHPHRPAAGFPAVAGRQLPFAIADSPQTGERLPSLAVLPPQLLLEHFSAGLVLIDTRGAILYFYGQTGRYLDHPTGEADLNLFSMAGGRLSRRLRPAVRQALENDAPIMIEGVTMETGNGSLVANVTVRPFVRPGGSDRLLAVVFEEALTAVPARAADSAEAENSKGVQLVEQLETELKAARAELQATTEEFETANEELRAAAEEAVSMNEELQSANQELEASREEVQSVNEELTTLNTQLSERMEELTATNNDLSNLIGSTDIATIFLDRELRIRRFTPKATELFNLIGSDVSRPIGQVSPRSRGVTLADEAQKVLENMATVERELRTDDNRWYLMRVLPYLTLGNRIDGVVATFSEISELKRAEESLQDALVYAEGIVETVRDPLLVLDAQLRVVSANRAFYRTFQARPEDTQGVLVYEMANHQWDIPSLRHLLEQVIPENAQFQDFEVEHEFPGMGMRTMLLNGGRIDQAGGRRALILLAIVDVTEKLDRQKRLVEAERARAQAAEGIAAEVTHRMKNNLAILSGLLDMQSRGQAGVEAAAMGLRDAISRVSSLSAVHDQLYGTRSEKVEVKDLLRRLGDQITAGLAPRTADLTVSGSAAHVSSKVGTALAIVVSELITNAIKHGGPEGDGILRIKLRVQRRLGKLRLSVWNSGKPLPRGFDAAKQRGMGLLLAREIVTGQLNGAFALRAHRGGTRAEIVVDESMTEGTG
jgi:two-component system CheB/CheR fusion protein